MRHLPLSFRVLSVDPGNNMGICISEIDVSQRTLKVLEVITVVVDKAIRLNDYQRLARYTKRELAEPYLSQVLTELLERYDVDCVVYEAAYNSKSLNAYESLLFYGRVINKVSLQYDWDLLIQSISPSSVKKINGVQGTSSDKDLVTEAVRNNSQIILPDHIDLDELSEHAIDSIAIAYCVLHDLMDSLPPLR